MLLKSIITQYKPALLKKSGQSLLPSQWHAMHAMHAIECCRTAQSGERCSWFS